MNRASSTQHDLDNDPDDVVTEALPNSGHDKFDRGAQPVVHRIIVPTPALDQLKANLLQYMKAEGISQSELARRIGIQARAISRLVSDASVRHSPTLETLEAVAAGLGLTVPELLSADFVAEAHRTPKHVQVPECIPRQLARLVEDFMHCSQAKRRELLTMASRLAEGDRDADAQDAQSSVPPPKATVPPRTATAPKVARAQHYFPPFTPPRGVARL